MRAVRPRTPGFSWGGEAGGVSVAQNPFLESYRLRVGISIGAIGILQAAEGVDDQRFAEAVDGRHNAEGRDFAHRAARGQPM